MTTKDTDYKFLKKYKHTEKYQAVKSLELWVLPFWRLWRWERKL